MNLFRIKYIMKIIQKMTKAWHDAYPYDAFILQDKATWKKAGRFWLAFLHRDSARGSKESSCSNLIPNNFSRIKFEINKSPTFSEISRFVISTTWYFLGFAYREFSVNHLIVFKILEISSKSKRTFRLSFSQLNKMCCHAHN